ncbi:MAG: hypothetical protein Ct9H300mP28_21780 [Pseudomonadota bacterium]|nr:MAG: hypothetical protein Ct9H300mP28_21780 [Pseudomonadota bacterium]
MESNICRHLRSGIFRRAVTEKTRAIFIENLANPGGIVVDLEAIVKIANEAGVPLVVEIPGNSLLVTAV